MKIANAHHGVLLMQPEYIVVAGKSEMIEHQHVTDPYNKNKTIHFVRSFRRQKASTNMREFWYVAQIVSNQVASRFQRVAKKDAEEIRAAYAHKTNMK